MVGLDKEADLAELDKEVGQDKEVDLDMVVGQDMVVGDMDKEVGLDMVVGDMDLLEREVDLTFILYIFNIFISIY